MRGSLGVLLARHQAGMRAVALSMIGYGPDTDDVVQDAALLALRRIQDVRNPEAVGPWLRGGGTQRVSDAATGQASWRAG